MNKLKGSKESVMSCCIGMDFFPNNFMHHEADDQPSITLSPLFPQNFHEGKRSNNIKCCEETLSHGDPEELSDEEGGENNNNNKKRRLNTEQVKALEKSFEVGNKLEAERKMQLARALGLQPRQIAIWFQNRRARWKTKQLERDYEGLKRQFEVVKAENDALRAHNQKIHAQIMAVKKNSSDDQPTESINLNKETQGSCSNNTTSDENSTPVVAELRIHNLIHHSLKMDPTAVKQQSLISNIFCGGSDDHSAFFPWLDQHHFN